MKGIMMGIWMGSLVVGLMAGPVFCLGAEENQQATDDGSADISQFSKMQQSLGLTDDQMAKLKVLFKEHWEATKALKYKAAVDMLKLKQEIQSGASDREVKKTLDALTDDHEALQKKRQKLVNQLRDTLTPTQQGKLILGMVGLGMEMMHR